MEYYVTQLMSGESKHFPTVISASPIKFSEPKKSGFIRYAGVPHGTERQKHFKAF